MRIFKKSILFRIFLKNSPKPEVTPLNFCQNEESHAAARLRCSSAPVCRVTILCGVDKQLLRNRLLLHWPLDLAFNIIFTTVALTTRSCLQHNHDNIHCLLLTWRLHLQTCELQAKNVAHTALKRGTIWPWKLSRFWRPPRCVCTMENTSDSSGVEELPAASHVPPAEIARTRVVPKNPSLSPQSVRGERKLKTVDHAT